MKRNLLFLSLLTSLLFFAACQREKSFENGGRPSLGSLLSDASGDCLPKTVVGAYEEGEALNPDSNYIEVQVNVGQTGSYLITTDTLNGIYFKGTGVFTATGITTVRVAGYGTPLATGVQNFLLSYDSTECVVAVTTLPAGGGVPAAFTLAGAPGNCTGADVQGVYTVGTPLTVSNTVEIAINVTTPGTYSITTVASNGMVFSGTGTIGSSTQTSITLTGSGTPAATGTTPIPITIGATQCSFNVDVVGPATYTVNCGSAGVNGIYTQGEALDASNTVDIDVTVTTPGAYAIAGIVNGMTFTATGNFAAGTTTATVSLIGSGTPTTDGDFDVAVTGGTAGCTFPITVEAGDPGGPSGTGTWEFTVGGITYTGTFDDIELTDVGSGYAELFMGGPSTANPDEYFQILLEDGNVSHTNGETYPAASIPIPPANFGAMSYDDPSGFLFQAFPGASPNSLVLTITSHNTTTKTVVGTFSGNVSTSGGGPLQPLTGGKFSGTYQ